MKHFFLNQRFFRIFLRQIPFPLLITEDLPDGLGNVAKYIHFGLKSALKVDSPGLYFKKSTILQYASIYKTNPELQTVCQSVRG